MLVQSYEITRVLRVGDPDELNALCRLLRLSQLQVSDFVVVVDSILSSLPEQNQFRALYAVFESATQTGQIREFLNELFQPRKAIPITRLRFFLSITACQASLQPIVQLLVNAAQPRLLRYTTLRAAAKTCLSSAARESFFQSLISMLTLSRIVTDIFCIQSEVLPSLLAALESRHLHFQEALTFCRMLQLERQFLPLAIPVAFSDCGTSSAVLQRCLHISEAAAAQSLPVLQTQKLLMQALVALPIADALPEYLLLLKNTVPSFTFECLDVAMLLLMEVVQKERQSVLAAFWKYLSAEEAAAFGRYVVQEELLRTVIQQLSLAAFKFFAEFFLFHSAAILEQTLRVFEVFPEQYFEYQSLTLQRGYLLRLFYNRDIADFSSLAAFQRDGEPTFRACVKDLHAFLERTRILRTSLSSFEEAVALAHLPLFRYCEQYSAEWVRDLVDRYFSCPVREVSRL